MDQETVTKSYLRLDVLRLAFQVAAAGGGSVKGSDVVDIADLLDKFLTK